MKALLRGDTPDSLIAVNLQLLARSAYLINQADYSAAVRLLGRALGEDIEFWGDEKVDLFLGAAVVHRGLGEEAKAERQLENALLTIPTLDATFNMGHYAAKASGLLRVWGREAEAREWDSFIGQLKMPEKTAGLFRERAARIVERSESRGRVFLC